MSAPTLRSATFGCYPDFSVIPLGVLRLTAAPGPIGPGAVGDLAPLVKDVPFGGCAVAPLPRYYLTVHYGSGAGAETLPPCAPLGMKGRWVRGAQRGKKKKKSALGIGYPGGGTRVGGFVGGVGRAAQCCRLADERDLRADDRFVGQRQRRHPHRRGSGSSGRGRQVYLRLRRLDLPRGRPRR